VKQLGFQLQAIFEQMVAIGTLARDGVNNLACPIIITFGKQLPQEVRPELYSETDGSGLNSN